MMHRLRLVAILPIVAMVVGAFAMRLSILSARDERPVHLPLPGVDMTASDIFEISSGGRFELQIVTSATRAEQAMQDRVAPDSELFGTLTITGPHGFRLKQAIRRMHLEWGMGDTDTYATDDAFTLPRSGQYDIAFESIARPQMFIERGGMVRIARVAPSGYGIRYVVLSGLTYLCFALALVATFLITIERQGGQ